MEPLPIVNLRFNVSTLCLSNIFHPGGNWRCHRPVFYRHAIIVCVVFLHESLNTCNNFKKY
jgi:hypothetical protein